jgi:choline dehydrogenase-like flavoprotein
MSDKPIDVAVVGAGVSGVYAAWRLKTASPDRSVIIFEASDRVGGRLLSVRPPGIPDMVAELGGMRILPEVQPHIKRLLEVLNQQLPADRRIDTFEFPVDQPQNLAYLRGRYLRLSDFARHPDKVPYALTFLERGLGPGALLLSAIEQVVPGVTRPGLTEGQRRQRAREAEFRGVPLYQQGFWNVLARVLSGEAYSDAQGWVEGALQTADTVLGRFGLRPL